MDPNETLASIRNARDDYNMASSIGQQDDAAERVIEHFEALDSWLSRGGFLPDAWDSEPDFTGARPHVNPDEEEDEEDDRGPNARFQMYTREGNDAVAAMVQHALAEAERDGAHRSSIIDALRTGVREVAKVHPEVHDTEPRGEILDVLDAWLVDHDFRPLGFEESL